MVFEGDKLLIRFRSCLSGSVHVLPVPFVPFRSCLSGTSQISLDIFFEGGKLLIIWTNYSKFSFYLQLNS